MDPITSAEVKSLLARASIPAGFPPPIRPHYGARPAVYDRAAVEAWRSRTRPVRSTSTVSTEGMPKIGVEPPTLIPLPTEAMRVRSLIRDLNVGPGKKPPPCRVWAAALGGARYSDVAMAMLAAENRRPSNRRFLGGVSTPPGPMAF